VEVKLSGGRKGERRGRKGERAEGRGERRGTKGERPVGEAAPESDPLYSASSISIGDATGELL
jgi:hypothetical protein